MVERVEGVERVETPFIQYRNIMMVVGISPIVYFISGEPDFNPLNPLTLSLLFIRVVI
jgi:hypothetical protein